MERQLRGHRAVFTGFLSQEELARIYASADVFVFPSTTDTFGNVVLEAQASGIPVVVTDQGGPQELVLPGRSGLVISGNDTGALTEAMRFLVERPEIRRALGFAAREFTLDGKLNPAEQFSTFFEASTDLPSPNVEAGDLLVGSAA
jgi:glycosyltransferase involved in cell wall biosynthesis